MRSCQMRAVATAASTRQGGHRPGEASTRPASAGGGWLPVAAAVVVAAVMPVPVVMIQPVAELVPGAVVVAHIAAGPAGGLVGGPTRAVAAGAEGGRARGVAVPATIAAHDHGLPGPLIDVDDDPPVRGAQRDLPHRAVVQ